MPKFGMNVPHFRCDSHTSFKVKRSKVRVTDGREHIVSAEPGGHTACLILLGQQKVTRKCQQSASNVRCKISPQR